MSGKFVPLNVPVLNNDNQGNVLFFDSFAGTSSVAEHSPEIPGGYPWSVVNGSLAVDNGLWALSNNARAVVELSTYNVDMRALLWIDTGDTSGLALRYTNESEFYSVQLNAEVNKVFLYRNGVVVTFYAYPIASNASYKLRVVANDDNIKVWIDDVAAIDYTDATPLTYSAKVGYDSGADGENSGAITLGVYELVS